MKEDTNDAESNSRLKESTAKEHLEHLLKIGWKESSQLIKGFRLNHNLFRED